MVEPDCGNAVLVEGAVRYGLHQGRLAGVLQAHDCDLQFLVEELPLDPVQKLIDESQHLLLGINSSATYQILSIRNCRLLLQS